jgi:hypothetical protein
MDEPGPILVSDRCERGVIGDPTSRRMVITK